MQATCQDALSGLPHDHCANYLAHVLAEACALLGEKDALLQTFESYRAYFDKPLKAQEYFQPKRRPLLGEIPMLVRYLQQNETGLYRKALWKLRWSARPGSASGRSKEPLIGIPWFAWWIILVLALQLLRSCQ